MARLALKLVRGTAVPVVVVVEQFHQHDTQVSGDLAVAVAEAMPPEQVKVDVEAE